MSKQISLTIPPDPVVAGLAAEFFDGLASHLRAEGGKSKEFLRKLQDVEAQACQHCGAFPVGAEIYEEPTDDVDAPDHSNLESVQGGPAVTTEAAPPPPAAEATDAATAFGPGTEAAPPPPAAEAPPGVELDKDGLPWDSRINTASKLKLKKEGTWKLTRNIDPTLVEQVRAELRAAMAASPASPVVAEVGSTDVPPVAPAPGAETVAPAPPAGETTVPAGSAEPLDFAGFMAKVTAAGVTEPVVLAAVKKAGLASIVLLATRPDLIPTVHAELFP